MNTNIFTRYNYLIIITFTANQNTQSSTNGRSINDSDHEFSEACQMCTDSEMTSKTAASSEMFMSTTEMIKSKVISFKYRYQTWDQIGIDHLKKMNWNWIGIEKF